MTRSRHEQNQGGDFTMNHDIQRYVQAGRRVHFIGIGGVGMSGLAKVLKHWGLVVSGSDLKQNQFTKDLVASGIDVKVGHEAAHIEGADFAVYSSAIAADNTEKKHALLREIPCFHRAELLSSLMNRGVSIGITGTHGKTTTSALISFLLSQAGLQPTCLVGGNILNFGSNVLLGDPHFMVSEVDESDRTHLYYQPDFTVLTNLEEDHMDVYGTFGQLKASFREFVDKLKVTGHVIYCAHDSHLSELTKVVPQRVDYGFSKDFHFGADEIVLEGFRSRFRLHEAGKPIGQVSLILPGAHNILNALGAIAALRTFGLSYDVLLGALPKFRGAGRRLEVKLDQKGLLVIDDYAHHPTEVTASLNAIHTLGKRTTVVFQPHRYSRTQYLGELFSKAFDHADRLILTDIYSANEDNPNHVDVNQLYQLIKNAGHPNVQVIAKNQIIDYLLQDPVQDGVIAFLGAGDIGEVAGEFAARFQHADTE